MSSTNFTPNTRNKPHPTTLLIGRLVKWIESRTENLISTGFARDYHMHGEMALKRDGKMFYFCCPGCQGRFRKQPDKCLALA